MFEASFDELTNADAKAFYAQHWRDDIANLVLKSSGDDLAKARAIQLDARKRAQQKLPSWFNNSRIVFPPKANLEQASSEQTAQYKASLVDFDTSIDLTGGTGIDSWQFALRAKKHTYVEPNAALCRLTAYNFNALGQTNIEIINQKAETFIENFHASVDLIFIDPSRRVKGGRKVVLNEYEPDVLNLLEALVNKANNVLIKVSPLADITYLIKSFSPFCTAIHVVALNNECKEILIVARKQGASNISINTINLMDQGNHQVFSFNQSAEAENGIIAKAVEAYIYEPNAAIMNAGAFNSISQAFDLKKLDKHAHVYTSTRLIPDFPGNVYSVLEVSKPYKLTGQFDHVSITSRNFPEKPDQIRKRLGYKDGNTFRLYATTLAGKKTFVMCKPS